MVVLEMVMGFVYVSPLVRLGSDPSTVYRSEAPVLGASNVSWKGALYMPRPWLLRTSPSVPVVNVPLLIALGVEVSPESDGLKIP
jgi:hypothetical protein